MSISFADVVTFAAKAVPEIKSLLELFQGDHEAALEHLKESVAAKRAQKDEALRAKYDAP